MASRYKVAARHLSRLHHTGSDMCHLLRLSVAWYGRKGAPLLEEEGPRWRHKDREVWLELWQCHRQQQQQQQQQQTEVLVVAVCRLRGRRGQSE